MLKIHYKNVFEKDVKLAKKRGLDIDKLMEVITLLAADQPLPKKFKDHSLVGNYKGYRECHIQPDWLIIYKKIEGSILFVRTGTHADLFKG